MIDKKLKILEFETGKAVSRDPDWYGDWSETLSTYFDGMMTTNTTNTWTIYTGMDGAETFERTIYGPPPSTGTGEVYGPASGYNTIMGSDSTHFDLDYQSLYPATTGYINITPSSATTTTFTI